MCFNMSLVKEVWELEEEFAALFEQLSLANSYGSSGFTHPSWPVIPSEDPNHARMVRWGLIPFWTRTREEASKLRNMTLNARLETAWKLPSFRSSIGGRRCLVPVDGYYEPHRHEGKSYPFYIYRKDRRPFALGGIYDRWKDPDTGRSFATFSILTVTAAGIAEKIHNHKLRMPAMIPREAYSAWLDPDLAREEVQETALGYPLEELQAHPVGPMLYAHGDKEDRKSLQEPWEYNIPAVDQLVSS